MFQVSQVSQCFSSFSMFLNVSQCFNLNESAAVTVPRKGEFVHRVAFDQREFVSKINNNKTK